MPTTISAALGFPTTYDVGVPLLSDQANIVEALRFYHYGDTYAGTGTPGGMEGHLADIYTYITSVLGSNILTVGTVTSGTWNADVIDPAYGGTGVSNTGTITVGGNFATVGAYTATLTLTGNTNITLPTSGTVVTTASTSIPSLGTVGTITSGTWSADPVDSLYGGTGFSSYAVGDILYASTTTDLSRLADVATGNVLLSGGVDTAPSWGKVNIETATTGVVQVDRGGTANSTVPTDGQILIGDGVAFNLTTLTAGSGIGIVNSAGDITIDNTGVLSVNGLTGAVDASGILAAVRARTTETIVTTSIATDANWTGTIDLGYSYRIISVETDIPARVRLYDTAAHRAADASRPIGTDPVGEHGVMMDMITYTGNLLYTSNPAIDGYNDEAVISISIPMTVTNLEVGGAQPVTVTIKYLRTE